MSDGHILSDELLRQLIAVGQVDVLVGVPTLDNAATVASVVRAVHEGFTRHFARQRTVMIHLDAGSRDGTPEIVREAGPAAADTVSASHLLRTQQRISVPYHGLPGKAGALRSLFASADLLQAKVLVVLDPDAANLTADWVAGLATPALRGEADFVSPRYARHPLEGPLVTQLVRPLVRATYGLRLHEPVGGEFGCSGRFAARLLEQPGWDAGLAESAADLWLVGSALAGNFRVVEAHLGPRTVSPATTRPGLPELFRQVVGAVFGCLDLHADYWRGRTGSEALPTFGAPGPAGGDVPALDPAPFELAFRQTAHDLAPVLGEILSEETFAEIRRQAEAPGEPVLADELWVRTVYEFALAHHAGRVHREHVAPALVGLYLGRLAGFLRAQAGSPPEAVEGCLEALALEFERLKPYLVGRWDSEPGR